MAFSLCSSKRKKAAMLARQFVNRAQHPFRFQDDSAGIRVVLSASSRWAGAACSWA